MFICLPILFGCPTKVKPEGNQSAATTCPRCHNATVFAAKSTTWFELFFVPLIPFSRNHIWMCGTCQWQATRQPGSTETHNLGATNRGLAPTQDWNPPSRPGYQPTYISGQPPQK